MTLVLLKKICFTLRKSRQLKFRIQRPQRWHPLGWATVLKGMFPTLTLRGPQDCLHPMLQILRSTPVSSQHCLLSIHTSPFVPLSSFQAPLTQGAPLTHLPMFEVHSHCRVWLMEASPGSLPETSQHKTLLVPSILFQSLISPVAARRGFPQGLSKPGDPQKEGSH